ncbi:hypothetical protein AGOR_G00172780 [Albula goreensis]|uniref:Ribonuclease A-domain domain-containing protein n=1 Tax=Albula goreensis TaxID=1534307 RepID=A0A8T3D2I2_9TELE|nr:hypothetical protein AGOR_G00172780 [Albula goreensis]
MTDNLNQFLHTFILQRGMMRLQMVGVVLLLVLCVAGSVQGAPDAYRHFLTQHFTKTSMNDKACTRTYIKPGSVQLQSTERTMKLQLAGVVLLLVLCVAGPVQGQSAYDWRRYDHFKKQHVSTDMNVNRCTNRMTELQLKDSDGECKRVNSFIIADVNQIKAVCRSGTHVGGNVVRSGQPFQVISCRRQSGDQHPNCQYRGRSGTRYIDIACNQGLPVHYDGDIQAA